MSDKHAQIAALPPEQRLLKDASRFDFFQAVLILERAAMQAQASRDANQASAPVSIGQDGPADREAVRFRALPTLSFPTAPVVSVTRPSGQDDAPAGAAPVRADMLVNFMGMAGATGALPDHYTSLLIQRIKYKDVGLRDFLDLFNHRLVSLFFRAWEKYRFESAYERRKLLGKGQDADASGPWGKADDFSSILLSLVGLGTGGLRGRSSVPDETIAFYAGHFSRHARCATSLEEILIDYFGIPCKIQQFVGQWLPLAEEDRSQLRRPSNGPSSFCTLGVDAVLGARVWDVQSKFRVRVGPLTYAQYVQLLPGGKGLRQMFDLVRFYVGVEFDFDVQPLLMASEIPNCRIGGDPNDPVRPPNRTGRNFWLQSRPARDEFDGALFASPLA